MLALVNGWVSYIALTFLSSAIWYAYLRLLPPEANKKISMVQYDAFAFFSYRSQQILNTIMAMDIEKKLS